MWNFSTRISTAHSTQHRFVLPMVIGLALVERLTGCHVCKDRCECSAQRCCCVRKYHTHSAKSPRILFVSVMLLRD